MENNDNEKDSLNYMNKTSIRSIIATLLGWTLIVYGLVGLFAGRIAIPVRSTAVEISGSGLIWGVCAVLLSGVFLICLAYRPLLVAGDGQTKYSQFLIRMNRRFGQKWVWPFLFAFLVCFGLAFFLSPSL